MVERERESIDDFFYIFYSKNNMNYIHLLSTEIQKQYEYLSRLIDIPMKKLLEIISYDNISYDEYNRYN